MEAAKNVKGVEATDSIKAGDFVLPPCVTKATQLRTECTHPCKVPIRVTVLATSADAVEADKTTAVAVVEGKTGRPKQAKKQCRDTAVAEGAGTAVADVKEEYTFFVTPEWTAPQYKEESDEWNWQGGETMHPFWGVRRASSTQAAKEGLQINMQMQDISFNSVSVGAIGGKACSLALTVTVPCMAPSQNITKHMSLVVLSEEPQKAATKRVKNWQTQIGEDEKEAKKHASAKAKPNAPKSGLSASTNVEV
jgi:hypothetical protein